MKKITLLLLLVLCSQVFSQKSINQYKYVIIPAKFDFVKKVDGYQTSSLTKFLFNKYGFTAFLTNEELPKDLEQNNCKALRADVVDGSKVFSTKSTIELKDCSGKVLFTSKQGYSRQKDYKKSYHEAIRQAFESVRSLNYKYNGFKEKANTNKKEIITKKEAPVSLKKEVKSVKIPVLKAQSIENGLFLQGKNKSFKVFKTSLPNVYAIENSNGLFYKDDQGLWNAEFTNSLGKKVIKKYNLVLQ